MKRKSEAEKLIIAFDKWIAKKRTKTEEKFYNYYRSGTSITNVGILAFRAGYLAGKREAGK
jgi:hypothetical protein